MKIRAVLLAMGCVAAALPVTGGAASARQFELTLQEGTRFSARMMPGGNAIVMDLQNGLWLLPAQGGEARRISADDLELTEPDISPDGKSIVVEGYDVSGAGIYLLDTKGAAPRRIARSSGEETQPRWSPDGKTLAFVSTRSGRAEVWALDVATGRERQLSDVPGGKRTLGWSADGMRVGFVSNGRELMSVPITGGEAEAELSVQQGIGGFAWAADGGLAYVSQGKLWVSRGGSTAQVGTFDDVFNFAPQWLPGGRLLYTANGQIRVSQPGGETVTVPMAAKVRFERPTYARKRHDLGSTAAQPVKGIVAPVLSPDGSLIAFRALNDVWVMPANGGGARRLTHDEAFENDPAWAPDGASIVVTRAEKGRFRIDSIEIASGARRVLVEGDGIAQRPAWSPDGRTLAYEDEKERLWLRDVASGQSRMLFETLPGSGRPSWSPDGRTILIAALRDNRNRYLAIDVASGKAEAYAVGETRSIATRQDNGPWWSPDGSRILFSMESTLWTMAVDARGKPLAPPIQITREISDAPSWGAGGKTVLYLSGGKLRLIDADGANPRTLDTGLEWSRPQPPAALLIRPEAVWDGRSPALRRGIEVLVEDGRITRMAATGTIRPQPGMRTVDAPGRTLVAGLIDMHVHLDTNLMQMGDGFGPLYLSFGITTLRSTGDFSYRNLEAKESFASGARTGPRLFTTGEYLEGSRFSWPESRPVENAEQIPLEIERARALDYDLVKTYFHFPARWQRAVTRQVHDALGIPLTSHYLYPNVAHGMDGIEHLGGPTHWGMDRTFIKSNNNLYSDVADAIVESGIVTTTTNFESSYLLRGQPEIVSDKRVAAFYQPWMRKALEGELACSQGNGPCSPFLGPNEAVSRGNATALVTLAKRGANIVAGTDAGLDDPAVSLHMNLRALQQAGMTPFEVLQAATSKSAAALNVAEDLGTIEPGKIADLILVDGDPSVDVIALANVHAVIQAGRYTTIEELIAPVP